MLSYYLLSLKLSILKRISPETLFSRFTQKNPTKQSFNLYTTPPQKCLIIDTHLKWTSDSTSPKKKQYHSLSHVFLPRKVSTSRIPDYSCANKCLSHSKGFHSKQNENIPVRHRRIKGKYLAGTVSDLSWSLVPIQLFEFLSPLSSRILFIIERMYNFYRIAFGIRNNFELPVLFNVVLLFFYG